MSKKRRLEIFSAGCAVCAHTVELVKRLACASCDVTVHDMQDIRVVQRAKTLGVRSVPAVAVNGELLACCVGRGVTEESLRAAGVGQPW